jgi:putative endonuclease
VNHTYYVYILGGRTRNLYTGVTNSLERRMAEHRKGLSKFAAQYKIFRLVYFEVFGDIRAAIKREKEIKSWRREKRVKLVEGMNPTWEDITEYLGGIRRAGKNG